MTQLGVTEKIFRKLIRFFDGYKREGLLPKSFEIGFSVPFDWDLYHIIDELKALPEIEPQVRMVRELSDKLLSLWNTDLRQLHETGSYRVAQFGDRKPIRKEGQPPQTKGVHSLKVHNFITGKKEILEYELPKTEYFLIDASYHVWQPTTFRTDKEYLEWSDGIKKERHFSFVELMKFINEVNGYCREKSRLAVSKRKELSGKQLALLYALDCHANGETLSHGVKKGLVKMINERYKTTKGVSAYNNYNNLSQKRIDWNSEKTLIELGGENWTTIIDYSINPQVLKGYLSKKGLI